MRKLDDSIEALELVLALLCFIALFCLVKQVFVCFYQYQPNLSEIFHHHQLRMVPSQASIPLPIFPFCSLFQNFRPFLRAVDCFLLATVKALSEF